ncbi:MAG: hypothetical protein ACREWG_01555, partial [Gammaproteobacteria bacterium]
VTDLVARWLLEGWCRQCIFNLKLPMKRRLETVWRCREAIGQTLADARLRHRLTFKHLYHDGIEVTGYITRPVLIEPRATLVRDRPAVFKAEARRSPINPYDSYDSYAMLLSCKPPCASRMRYIAWRRPKPRGKASR